MRQFCSARVRYTTIAGCALLMWSLSGRWPPLMELGGMVAVGQEPGVGQEEQEQEKEDEPGQETPPTAEELASKAMEAAQEGDLENGISLMRQAVGLEKDNLQYTVTLARMLQMHAHDKLSDDRAAANPYFYEAAQLARVALAHKNFPEMARPFVAQFIYNEACCLAIDGKQDEAIKSLEEAFAMGFDDVELAERDADFASIRESEPFRATLAKAAQQIAERYAAETREELKNFSSFDFDFTLPNLDGDEVSLADFKGKILIADFWGTWCGPCREEIPSFIRLKNEYHDRGLEIVGINYEGSEDQEEVATTIKDFATEFSINYPCVIGDEATQEQIENFGGYPTTLFIDRSGKVRLMLEGLHPYAKLKSIVEALLEEPSDP